MKNGQETHALLLKIIMPIGARAETQLYAKQTYTEIKIKIKQIDATLIGDMIE